MRHLDQLRILTESAALAGRASGGRGRYSRTPDFTAPTSGSTRPRSDRGTTFHFSHKVISKRNDISENNRTQTTSSAHQGYIERPSATAEADAAVRKAILDVPPPDLEDSMIADGYHYPDRVVDAGRASFGTLGKTKSERRAFWDDVEHHEGRKSRVQSRIIAELPHELSDAERASLACTFCQVFEERGLPYWATIHKPGKRNDDKNHHLHITYFDRPSGRNPDETWSHVYTETRQKKSRHRYKTRPHVSCKHPDTRLRDWPRRLRRNFSDTANFHLALGGYEKRYDPRSYKDSGIEKEPTEHLGNKLSSMEKIGLDTVPGRRNAKKEIRWRITRAEAPWVQRVRQVQDPDSSLSDAPKDDRDALIEIASRGITSARKAASLEIVSDLITRRVETRKAFLDTEVRRLSGKEDMSDLAERSMTVVALSSERQVVRDASQDLLRTAEKSRAESERHNQMNQRFLRLFDRRRKIIDPNLLFSEDTGAELEDFSDIPRDIPEHDPFDDADMRNIETLFEEDAGKTNEKKAFGTRVHGLPRIEQIVQEAAAWEETGRAEYDGGNHAEAFPEAWSIKPTRDGSKLVALDKSLRELDNRGLRHAAIATRDAADLSETGEGKADFSRGWAVLRLEAERRGVNLDTGQYQPELASDPERAALHNDQEPCPIRVVRKNIARQRVR